VPRSLQRYPECKIMRAMTAHLPNPAADSISFGHRLSKGSGTANLVGARATTTREFIKREDHWGDFIRYARHCTGTGFTGVAQNLPPNRLLRTLH